MELLRLVPILLALSFIPGLNAACEDKDKRCKDWADSGECNSNPAYMLANCKKSCKVCEETCKNKQKDCDNWVKQGFCAKTSKWYSYMKDNCKSSCNFCTSKAQKEEICKDKETDCTNWKTAGYCDKDSAFFDFMKTNCMKTCGLCKKKKKVVKVKAEKCEDKQNQCAYWASKEECTKNKKYMEANCKKSCLLCPGGDCKDLYNTKDCVAWEKIGECAKNTWMHVNCKKSCRRCTDSTSDKGPGPASVKNINSPVCGLRLKSRVVGGKDSALGDWPWQVGLAFKRLPNKVFCGGSLINEQWVVTAAHCFGRPGKMRRKPSEYVVRLAEHDLELSTGSEVISEVSDIIRHENYGHGSYDNDIALVKLRSPVKYNQLIKPVCLPIQGEEETAEEMCYVTGWGRTTEGGSTAKVLQEAKIPIKDKKVCEATLKSIGTYTKNMVCAGYKKGGIDACQGDSGGPLVCRKGGRFNLVGVVSWGSGCARKDLYGIYTKVSNYVDWVKSKISS